MHIQRRIFQHFMGLLVAIVFLLANDLYGINDINQQKPYDETNQRQKMQPKNIIPALESKDSSAFMPVIRYLAGIKKEAAKKDIQNLERAANALKTILSQNQDSPDIKEPAIQALIKVTGKSEAFEFLSGWNWNLQLYDSCREDWKDHWILDGTKATLKNTEKGMAFYAGPDPRSDSSHAVLWTKEYFKGDLKIEYDYTRLDEQTKFVNIIYIQATGSGEGYQDKDIAKWADKREYPAMSQYFGKMYIYHISYAAFTNVDGENKPGYIRARRYMADELHGTEIEPDYRPGSFFETNIPHHIKFIKTNRHLFMHISSSGEELLCHWYNTKFPPINEGYIGLRHMRTRAARYKDFKISELIAY